MTLRLKISVRPEIKRMEQFHKITEAANRFSSKLFWVGHDDSGQIYDPEHRFTNENLQKIEKLHTDYHDLSKDMLTELLRLDAECKGGSK